METIKTLPNEGTITVKDLGKFLGIRNDKLKKLLRSAGIKTVKLSNRSKYQFVNLSDLGACPGAVKEMK